MLDLDLRLVRYFTVVAEHLNFARAAGELRVAQPWLSRQIQRLENDLGVRPLECTTQGSRLAATGASFPLQAQKLMSAARQATAAALAAAPPRTITIGYVEDLVITPAVRDLRRRHPDAHVRTNHLAWNEARALPERRVDALLTDSGQGACTAGRAPCKVLSCAARWAADRGRHPQVGSDRLCSPCPGGGMADALA